MNLETEGMLISVDRLAELLQVSPRTVWRLVSAGQVPQPLRIGGNTRWRLDSVKEWIEQGCPARK
jgi:excisionase family DNA binding protein